MSPRKSSDVSCERGNSQRVPAFVRGVAPSQRLASVGPHAQVVAEAHGMQARRGDSDAFLDIDRGIWPKSAKKPVPFRPDEAKVSNNEALPWKRGCPGKSLDPCDVTGCVDTGDSC